jgi:hypothetical protein
MSEGPEEHLEHAEHAKHAAYDPFDRRVAMTIMVVAAVLACIKMLGHRAHTDTLRLQAEANHLQTQVDIHHTKAADQWNFYQAKNIRKHEYEAFLRMSGYVSKDSSKAEAQKEAEAFWQGQLAKYEVELPKTMATAEELGKKADEFQERSEDKLQQSERVHHRAGWFDSGELGIEIALVVCSVALLTKRRAFWYLGIVFALIGAAVAGCGFFPQ